MKFLGYIILWEFQLSVSQTKNGRTRTPPGCRWPAGILEDLNILEPVYGKPLEKSKRFRSDTIFERGG
jgi:hypothetical protein